MMQTWHVWCVWIFFRKVRTPSHHRHFTCPSLGSLIFRLQPSLLADQQLDEERVAAGKAVARAAKDRKNPRMILTLSAGPSRCDWKDPTQAEWRLKVLIRCVCFLFFVGGAPCFAMVKGRGGPVSSSFGCLYYSFRAEQCRCYLICFGGSWVWLLHWCLFLSRSSATFWKGTPFLCHSSQV